MWISIKFEVFIEKVNVFCWIPASSKIPEKFRHILHTILSTLLILQFPNSFTSTAILQKLQISKYIVHIENFKFLSTDSCTSKIPEKNPKNISNCRKHNLISRNFPPSTQPIKNSSRLISSSKEKKKSSVFRTWKKKRIVKILLQRMLERAKARREKLNEQLSNAGHDLKTRRSPLKDANAILAQVPGTFVPLVYFFYISCCCSPTHKFSFLLFTFRLQSKPPRNRRRPGHRRVKQQLPNNHRFNHWRENLRRADPRPRRA